MAESPRRPRREAWMGFRRRPKAHRRLGIALLVLALILTLLWARAPRASLAAAPGAGVAAVEFASAFVNAGAFVNADRHSA